MNKKLLSVYKTMLIVLTLVITAIIPLTIAESTNTSEEITVTYSFSQPMIQPLKIEEKSYKKIVAENLVTTGDPGDPMIPSKLSYVLLPPNTHNINITITSSSRKQMIAENILINPIEQPTPLLINAEPTVPQPNPLIYSSNQQYPGELYTEIGTYSFRGFSILALQLHPLQYNPVSGDLWYYPSFTIHLQPSYNKIAPLMYRGLPQDNYIAQTKVDNPQDITYYENLQPSQAPREDYDLMILTTESFKDDFIPLQTAHDAAGEPTVIKTLYDIGSSDLNDIRDYIRSAYLNMGVEYVLIGGDNNIFPAPILWVSGLDEGVEYYETKMPSDLFYACLDGTYNYDGDDKWGETTDGEDGGDVDLIADVYVGRACIGSTNEVANFVSKTISYLTKDPDDPYLAEICLAGEYMGGNYGIATWGGNYLDQLIDTCNDDGYTTIGIPSTDYSLTLLYDRDYPGHDWPKSEIINIINNDVHIINHLGHAYYEYDLKMSNSDVYGLTNDKHCFIYSQGCMAGGFDQGDCIAEAFTVKTDNAAFSVIMNARYGWFWRYSTDGDSQRFHREYWDAVFGESIPQIGRANHDSKEDNLGIIDRSCIRWVYYETNLFGDPLLAFFEYEGNLPPETPRKPTEKNGESNVFTSNTTDPENDDIEYQWDWGNGTLSNWYGPYQSGETIETEHYFIEPGVYHIRARARDTEGKESPWSTPLSYEVTTPILQITEATGGLFTLKAVIQNTAPISLTNITWNIRLEKGILLSGIYSEGTIDILPSETDSTITTLPILGLGISSAKIEIPGNQMNQNLLIIGPIILLL